MELREIYTWLHRHSRNEHVRYGDAGHGNGSEEFFQGYASVLDVGAGYTGFAAKLGLGRTAVTDISQVPAAEQCAKGVEFYLCEAKDMPFADGEFDVVCSFDVLEHIPPEDVDASIAEMMRVCKCRGVHRIATDRARAAVDGLMTELHLTVQPLEWWAERFAAYGVVRLVEQESTWTNSSGKQTRAVTFLIVDKAGVNDAS